MNARRERVHGLREHMEELLPMPWAPLSSGVAGTVNLSGKLGASGSSLAAKEQSVGDGDSELSRSQEAETSRSCEAEF
jgi:hypothetical protein